MDRRTYDDYLARFNARDYEGVLAYYDDDPEIVFAGYSLRGKDAVRRFYGFFHEYVREEIEITRFVSDADTIAMEATVRLTGLKAVPDGAFAELGFGRLMAPGVGQTIEIPQFIHYHLRNGRLARALCAVFEPPHA